MIWFNVDKGHGFIRTEEEERLYVAKDGFMPGEAPCTLAKATIIPYDSYS